MASWGREDEAELPSSSGARGESWGGTRYDPNVLLLELTNELGRLGLVLSTVRKVQAEHVNTGEEELEAGWWGGAVRW